MKLSSQCNRFQVGTSRCDVPDREVAGGFLAPLNAARTARRAVPTTEAQSGVALVITLILLAVITTLAIAFLALTYRETGSVDAMSRTTDAELAVDSGLERAKAQISAAYPVHNFNLIANPPVSPDILGPEMFVSVCWETNRLVPTNHLDGSVPVFVDVNQPNQPGPPVPLDDRFFLDLNRNGYFEETGVVRDLEIGPFGTNANNWRIGDPQWIGVPQDPRLPHGPANRYVARYAFMVLPAGRSLDLNWIHNQALDLEMRRGGYNGFYRNQGVGSWEINLAAFLADLNGNFWGYGNGFTPFAIGPQGAADAASTAFMDARELLRYRYAPLKFGATDWNLLNPQASPQHSNDTFNLLFGGRGAVLNGEIIDAYSDGPIAPVGTFSPISTDNPNLPWPGADSRRHFFSLHDFFDDRRLPDTPGFRRNLTDASTANSSYNRYTFYRMLAQMGTDSIPENDDEEGKININYVNIGSWKVPSNGVRLRATDLESWTNETSQFVTDMGRPGPELFFLSTVTNLLTREFPQLRMATGDPLSPLRIPVFTNGSRFWFTNAINLGPLYSARIHQILQQAANIYDALRGPSSGEALPFYPTVFRPQFVTDSGSGNVYIVDYRLVREQPSDVMAFSSASSRRWMDLDLGEKPGPDNGVYNIPLIIGARKGYPSFNEFVSRTSALAVRRLVVEKPPDEITLANARITEAFSLFVTNQFGFEAWNSYSSPLSYPRNLSLYYSNDVTVGVRTIISNSVNVRPTVSIGTNFFAAYTPGMWRSNTYIAPPAVTRVTLGWTNSVTGDNGGFTNRWDVYITNRLRFFLVDGDASPPRIVDAVTLSFTNAFLDLGNALAADDLGATGTSGNSTTLPYLWSRRRSGNRSLGVQQQLNISQNGGLTSDQDWKDYSQSVLNKTQGIDKFNEFVRFRTNVATTAQAPFSPSRYIVQINTWQVNDPLVHYTLDDFLSETNQSILKNNAAIPNLNLGLENPVYSPWGGKIPGEPDPNLMDASLRDPGLERSDFWDFPANKLPNLGWLGRVHRGTPWQTVYLKSLAGNAANAGTWKDHSGPSRSVYNALTIHPTNDWRLLDIFTAAIHPNATRGRLSVNQTNLAAWSAVLSGVTVSAAVNGETNGVGLVFASDLTVQPGAITNFVPLIVQGINNRRDQLPNRQFTKLSEFMSVPELTFKSPLLAANGFDALAPAGIVNIYDSDLERIPQQVLSLLKVGEPRFVIYAWGQSLKPARNGVVNNGGTLSLSGPSIDPGTKVCNNYQVTGEAATRAVVRVVFPEKLREPEVGPAHPLYLTPDYRKPRLVVESFNVIPVE